MPRALLLVACTLVLWASACAGGLGGDLEPLELVRLPSECERAEYVIVDDGRVLGRGTLHVARATGLGVAGWDLRQGYQPLDEPGFEDGSQAVVDDAFHPSKSTRLIARPISGDRYEGIYDAAAGTVETRYWKSEGKRQEENTRTLKLRQPAYDNESAFWLWRSLPLAEGFKVRYVSVNIAERTQTNVDLTVVGSAEVTVPAGTFDAWRLHVVNGRFTRTAWIEVAEPYRLIQWDNGETLMQLERRTTDSPLCLSH